MADLFVIHGVVAALEVDSGSLARETEDFTCRIGEHPVCGSFAGASKLPAGKETRAVVHRRPDGVLVAAAIMSESDGLLWILHAWGSKAEMHANVRLAHGLFVFTMVCISLSIVFLGVNEAWTKLETFGWGIVVSAVLCYGMALWSNAGMRALADPATETFRLLGFAHPASVDLNNYRYGLVHGHRLLATNEVNAKHFNIHCYRQAIDDGKLQLAAQ